MSTSSAPPEPFSPPEREQLLAVLRMLPVSALLVDAQGGLVEANAAAEALWEGPLPRVRDISEYDPYQGFWPDTGRRLAHHEWAVAHALLHGESVKDQEVDILTFAGRRRTVLNSAAPLQAPDGTRVGAVVVSLDITSRKQTERAESFVSEASALLAESLDWETTLKAVARLATRELADYCMVDVLDEHGVLQRVALTARDPARQALLEEALPFPPLLEGDTPVARAFKGGRAVLVPEITPAWRDAQARSPEHRRVLEALAPRSAMLLPLAVGSRRFGLINLASATERRFTAQDLAPAEEFARRAAFAVENARLYREARQAVRDRDASLALLEALLAASPVGMGFVDRELRYVHINPVLAAFNRLPVEAHLGRTVREVLGPAHEAEALVRRVLETGVPVEDQSFDVPGEGGEPRHLRASYFPVRAGGELLGIGAMVVEVTEQKREEDRLRFLAEATARLSTSLDWRTTLRTVARLMVDRLGDYCTVDVLATDGARLERLEVLARSASTQHVLDSAMGYAPQPGASSPIRRVLETGGSELLSDVDEASLTALAVSPEHRRVLAALRPCSVMFVPLVARGRTLGVISVVSQNPARRYGARDLAFLEDVASRAALAVDNAWLYREAEAAVKARDEFVAIATHELRTPLSALSLQLTSLQRAVDRGAPPPLERLQQSLGSARRQTERLNHLVTHLFDVARISSGRLELDREEVDLSALVYRLVARMEDALAAAGCAPVVHADEPVRGYVDKLRVEQVLMNLLTNATKYAPGQPVELSVERQDGNAVITVRDWGPGIPAEARERIFERFERATGEHARASLGLGLYISRQIARAHGGELIAEAAPPGPGARFVLRLPLG